MCRDISVRFKKGGKDLWDGAFEETGFFVYEICKAFGIYRCIDFQDDGAFDKVGKVECAYGLLV